MPEISEEDAIKLLDTDFEQLDEYLYYISAKHIKKLHDPQFRELMQIILGIQDEENSDDIDWKQVRSFTDYLKDSNNIKKLQKVFPIANFTSPFFHSSSE